ncbi:DUF6083 domain-containing protein [Streptomyces ochraceiscleroticus]|uniref:DUF6083 domain-containing protein n=1 Tax=Streptomyces ochraceiscleroticus TaxID=47761 RepID=A0ABW1MN13_9ACTN|nr:DUF6083 domain-containing protein [Streptomyces ochraceiscleroticus]
MHPHPASRHWDGSPRHTQPRRSLRVAPTSPSRLLRAGQSGRCRACGNRLEWYPRSDDRHRPIALHPAEAPTAAVPASCHWHLSCGTAYRHGDGSAWCRLPHAVLCPHRTTTRLTPHVEDLRRQLALRTRRLLDTGAFTPRPAAAPTAPAAPCRPTRPILQLLSIRYLAAHPVDAIRCVAQTRHRHRCPHPVLAPAFPGTWRLLPTGPAHGQLMLPDQAMAVYDLGHLPYDEQLRWRAQRCPTHATSPGAADLALPEWEVFDPLTHHQHLHQRLPTTRRRAGRS